MYLLEIRNSLVQNVKLHFYFFSLQIVQMNNYCGLGIDAELSLGFHHAREEEPDKFNSRYLVFFFEKRNNLSH